MLQSDSPCTFALNSKITIYNMLFKLGFLVFILLHVWETFTLKALLLLVHPKRLICLSLGKGANYRLGLIRGALKLLQRLQHISPDVIYLLPEARSAVCLGLPGDPTSCWGSQNFLWVTCEVGLLKPHRG